MPETFQYTSNESPNFQTFPEFYLDSESDKITNLHPFYWVASKADE